MNCPIAQQTDTNSIGIKPHNVLPRLGTIRAETIIVHTMDKPIHNIINIF